MEDEVKKTKNKKALMGIGAVVAIIVIIIGVMAVNVYKDVKQKNILNEELEEISKKQVGSDDFNTEIKTTGDYAKVEQTIKNYLQKYSDAVKGITENSEKIASIQGAVEKDKLEERKAQVQEIKTSMSDNINTMVEMTSEEYVKKQIEQENLSQKYVDIYNKLMLEDLSSTLSKVKDDMSNNKEKIDELFDKVIETYDYLLAHPNSWVLQNGQILFYNSKELSEYNKIVQEVQTKSRLLTITNSYKR